MSLDIGWLALGIVIGAVAYSALAPTPDDPSIPDQVCICTRSMHDTINIVKWETTLKEEGVSPAAVSTQPYISESTP